MRLNGRRRVIARGHKRRPHNLRFGLVVSVVRTVQAEVQPGEEPVFALDLQLGTHSWWVTWS